MDRPRTDMDVPMAPVPALDKQEAQAKFDLPVDSEHKALKIKLLSFANPHMRAFHICWMAFFASFVSTFAPAAMLPVIRDAINITKPELGNAGIAAVTGTIGARVLLGSICDVLGPRLGMSLMLLISSPCVFGMALANTPLAFTMLRFGIGFGLSSFVACQYWTSQMFNVKIVGLANATTGGWGNLGGGVTQLLMPLVFKGISSSLEPFIAWRWAFFVPGGLHILTGILILYFSQDLPDGNYATLHKSGAVKPDSGVKMFLNGVRNYRTWIMVIIYGFCFGIELTMNNIIVSYLFDNFTISLTIAGLLGSLFGLMNIVARSFGGQLSDLAGSRFGMRGRLWTIWGVQTLEGVFCIAMGLATATLPGTIILMVCFSICVQAAEGASFGVVPFISKRSLGIVSGLVGAGGNAGSVITQTIFFKDSAYTTDKGIIYMGIMIIGVTLLVFAMWFPMWGGMIFPARAGATEEDYYLGEYSADERAAGIADVALKFANESKSQRGRKALAAEAAKSADV